MALLDPTALFISVSSAVILSSISWVIYTRHFHPYSSIPGPFLASITSLHRWYNIRYGIDTHIGKTLHDRYGPFVRIAPNEVQISLPEAIDAVSRSSFTKTDFYDSFDPKIGGRTEVFAEKDEKKHAKLRKTLNPLFRPEAVGKYEGYIDHILQIVCNNFDKLLSGKEVDLADYVTRFTWDVVGNMVYSREDGFGMLKEGGDYMGWRSMIKIMQWHTGQLGYLPYGTRALYFLLQLIISRETRKGLLAAISVTTQVRSLIKQRQSQEAAGENFRPEDMLSRMLVMARDEKIDFNEDDIVLTLNAFVWAGSDTTAGTLTMILYYILRDERVYTKLQQELDSAMQDGISYQDASSLPYLKACITEGMRFHFIVGTGLPRTVPPGGAHICGKFFPGGYKVQVNSNVAHLARHVFGEDADEFRPERWMDNDKETLARMKRYSNPFGYGTRVCIGQQIALQEIYKFVPVVLSRYHLRIVREPIVTKGWFQQPEGLVVKVVRR